MITLLVFYTQRQAEEPGYPHEVWVEYAKL
jgi:hypothetical protein